MTSNFPNYTFQISKYTNRCNLYKQIVRNKICYYQNSKSIFYIHLEPIKCKTLLLVRKEKLHLLDDKSDKVYEVNLFHIQENEYIVNFRYGRRGRRLTEGTKTVFPVSKEQAEKVFEELVASKTKKGYKIVSNYSESTPTPTAAILKVQESGAKPVVLSYLKQRANGETLSTNWKLSRIIWRAGELNIEEAIPYIKTLLPSLKGQELYSAVWTLGRIATPESKDILGNLLVKHTELHYNIFLGGLVHCKDKSIESTIVEVLPAQLAASYTAKDYNAYGNILKDYLFVLKSNDANFLLHSYYLTINDKRLKEVFLPILKEVPLIPGNWKYIRYIFKIAEMIEDGETFGIIARSVNLQKAYYSKPLYGNQVHHNGQRLQYPAELSSAESKIAFSNRTKDYLTKRVLKRLSRAGYDRQESYCKFAAGVLSAYSTTDERIHNSESSYTWDSEARRSIVTNKDYLSVAHIPYFYYILFGRGDRLNINDKLSRFFFKDGASAMQQREDSFPMLWDSYPQYVVDILVKARQEFPVKFALMFLSARSDVDSLLSLDTLIKLVDHPFDEVLEFSLGFIEKRYDAHKPNENLIIKLIETNNAKAVDLAITLINKNKDPFVKNLVFVKTALLSKSEDLHIWLRENIKEESFTEEEQVDTVEHCLSSYLEFNEDTFNTDSADSLIHIFKTQLSKIEPDRILEMLGHPRLQIQILGAKLINVNERDVDEWPAEIMMRLLSSSHNEIRDEGMRMLGKLTDEQLAEKTVLIAGLASSPHQDLRLNAREIIGRIAPNTKEFGAGVFTELYHVLLEDHDDPELPADVFTTLETHLLEHTPSLIDDLDTILGSSNREIHLLTHQYVKSHADLQEWPIRTIARLGTHDMKSLRELGHAFYTENVDKIKYYKHDALYILDTDLQDTRAFAQAYFEKNFGEKEWDPELIIALCDNVRPETQEFGTKILGQQFKEEHGAQYLKALSEHPDPVIQLYTTNYLDRYAMNNMDILAHIQPYFIRILSAINTKRVAKLRVIHFLEKQAAEGKEQAKYVTEVLNELLGTIAVRENETYVSLLRKIELEHSDIDTNLEIVPLEIR